MKTDLEKIMKDSGSIIDLEEKLKSHGHQFKTYKKYINFLRGEWEKRTPNSIEEVLNSPIKDDGLPSLKVEVESTTYLLHGIYHGMPAVLAPGWHPRKQFRKYVSAKADSYHNLPDETYFYEEGLGEPFDFLWSNELQDVTKTQEVPKSLSKKVMHYSLRPLTIPASILGLFLMPPLFLGIYIYSKSIKDPKGKVPTSLYLSQKALSDAKYQVKAAKFDVSQEMPQPLQLEGEYIKQKGASIKLLYWLIGVPNAATVQERSLWTAKELLKKAKKHDLKRVHYIGGLGHSTEIAYFLKNPNYSFEQIEKYRILRKK